MKNKKDTVGNRIKKARNERNITQRELSQKLKCTEIMISRYELGVSQVSIVQLAKISEILDKPISYFFYEENQQNTLTRTEPTTQMKNAFIFDLDETLVDVREFCGETCARVITNKFPEVSFNLVVQLHDSLKGPTIEDLYKIIIKELDLVDANLEEFLIEDKKIMELNLNKMKLFEGSVEILEFLKQNNKKLYICTNRLKVLMDSILNATEIRGYFDEIISCVDMGYKKPNPYCLINLMERNKLKKEECIYFGDSLVDTQFAENAGIEYIIFDQYLNNKNLFKKLVNMFLEK